MARNGFFFILLLVVVIAGCDSQSDSNTEMKPWEASDTNTLMAGSNTRAAATPDTLANKTKYLAYEHFITIDLSEHDLELAYQKLLTTCNHDQQHHCTVLESNINSGDYPSATIRLRVNPEGVQSLTELVTQSGRLTNQSTRVEDLASPIIDSEKRIAMLTAHRERLLALEEKAAKDIDALIKISQELSTTQANLEDITGQNQYLMQRVNMQVMNITLVVNNRLSFWKPIKQSLDNFSTQLAYGIASVIQTLAKILPWLLIALLCVGIIKIIRNRKNR